MSITATPTAHCNPLTRYDACTLSDPIYHPKTQPPEDEAAVRDKYPQTAQYLGVDDYDDVANLGSRVVDGLVLALQKRAHHCRDAAGSLALGVD